MDIEYIATQHTSSLSDPSTDIWIHLEPLELWHPLHPSPSEEPRSRFRSANVHSAMYRTELYQAKVLNGILRNGGDRMIFWHFDAMLKIGYRFGTSR